jgi:hypothetical protein
MRDEEEGAPKGRVPLASPVLFPDWRASTVTAGHNPQVESTVFFFFLSRPLAPIPSPLCHWTR